MKPYWILDNDGMPVPTGDVLKWAAQLEDGPLRIVRQQMVYDCGGLISPFAPSFVSTVFLGLDHQFGDGPPLIYETMVLRGFYFGHMSRYPTRQAAEQGHQEMVEMIQDPAELIRHVCHKISRWWRWNVLWKLEEWYELARLAVARRSRRAV